MTKKNILKTMCIFLLATSIIFLSTGAMGNISEVQLPMKAVWLNTENTPVQPRQVNPLGEIWIHFDDGINHDGIGMGGGGTWEGAIRMTPGELRYYENWKIVVVKWYHFVLPGGNTNNSGNIKIYSQGEPNLPGSLLTSEPYTVTKKGWCEIPLSNPVTISGQEDVWVSNEITHMGGEYPLGVDAGPAIVTKGDWIYSASQGWLEMRIMGMNYNWNMQVLLVGGEDHEPPITTCNLSGEQKDDVYISNVNITLKAIDYLTGVNRTMYKIDNNEWQTYLDPVIVAENGDHILYYYSVDNAGNIETAKNTTFTIQHPLPPLPPIIITVHSGLGVLATIKNNGTTNLTNVTWTITLDGKLVFFGKTKTDTIATLDAEKSITVRDFVLGFGKTGINVKAGEVEVNATGKVILFFVTGVK